MATFAIAPDITTLNLSGTDGQIDLTYRIDDPDNSFSNSDIGSAAVTIFFNNEVLINVDQISLGDINGTPVGTIPITGGRSLSEDTFDIDGNLDTTSFALVQLRNLNPIETVDGAVLLSIPFSTTGAFDGQTQISFDASNLSGLGVPDITPVTVLEGAPTLVITPQSQDISISDGAGEIILNYRFDNFSSPFISGAVFRVFFNDEISVGDIVVPPEVGTVSSRSLGLDSTNLDSDDTTNNLVRLAFFPLNSPTSDTLFVTIPFTTTAVFDGETSVNFGVSNAPSQIFVQPIGSVTATVTNQAPVITSAAEFSVPENITALGTIVAEDADAGAVLEYSISGGDDADLFAIDAGTGDLTFIAAPDYEVPGDDGGDNVYNVQVSVTDGFEAVSQDLTVTVTDLDEIPPIVATIAASDANAAEEGLDPGEFTITLSEAAPEGGLTVSYTVGGTADANDYTALTGTVTIAAGETTATIALTPLNDELLEPGDDETVVVTLTDAEAYDLGESNEATVTIADNDAPSQTIELSTPDTSLNAGEAFVVTVTYDVTDADNTLTGIGVRVHYDSSEIEFDESAVLFGTPFAPIAQGSEEVSDGDDETDSQVTFAYTDFTGNFPNTDLPVDLLTLSFTTLSAFDGSSLNVTFIDGGLASGYSGQADSLELTLPVALPTVTIAATTADAAEEGTVAGQFTVTLSETAPVGGLTVAYSVAGTAAIDGSDYTALSGTVTIAEGATTATIDVTPVDDSAVEAAETVIVTLNADASYDLGTEVEATVTIADNDVVENQDPVITSPAAFSVAENITTVGTILAEDPENNAITFALAGADADLFTISNLGGITFKQAPDFETPQDQDENNIYDVTVEVSDGTNDVTQAVTISVTNVNEAPIAVNDTASLDLQETPSVTIRPLENDTDPEGNTLTITNATSENGTVTIQGDTLLYKPQDGFDGTSILSYTISDGVNQATANVEVTVTDTELRLDPLTTEVIDPDLDSDLNLVNLAFDPTENGNVNLDIGRISNTPLEEGSEEFLKVDGGTDAVFDNLVGLYEVINPNGGIQTADGVLNPGDAGYALAALTTARKNFTLRAGAGVTTIERIKSESGDILLDGGKFYAPFVIANAGAIGVDGFITAENAETDGIFNEAAEALSDAVAYFSFVDANPDGVGHLRSYGNGVFGFEDLPGNLPGISDKDFNDAVFAFNFSASA